MASSSQLTAEAVAPGALIAGRYRIDDTLGKGGVGEVYRVTDISTGSVLALKRLQPEASADVQSLFEKEYQTLASLKHPHTVEVYEFGRDELGAFYTMELLEGGDLRERVPLNFREACAALRDAAMALGVLHARGLVHRDVSPRNLWRTPDGRVKLIDFGAITSFGRAQRLMGTPPLLPPEAYSGGVLDQRSDLFSLGGVGYFLVTGRNAFPAREIQQLPELWRRLPRPPSTAWSSLPEATRRELEPIPAELDALLLGLLSQNPLLRPSSTAELIDRLNQLIGRAHTTLSDAGELHFANSAFVGRHRERRRLGRQMLLATRGHGQSALIEGGAGMGRSRTLHELALQARVADTTVLHVDAASYPVPYGVASALMLKLLDALPSEAPSALAAHAQTLAHASLALRERLGVRMDKPPEIAGELRVRIQTALVEVTLALCRSQTLVILIDNLEQADDGSAAFLLRLAQHRKGARFLLACSLLSSSVQRPPTAAERALMSISHRTRLRALSEADTLELLQSVLGKPEHLIRLAHRLHRTARGVPGHILELASELMRSDAIRFADGTWVLPQDVPEGFLPDSWQQVLAARLQRITGPARELARVLSVQAGAIPEALQDALAARLPEREQALDVLLEHEIMTYDADGLRFSHEQFRLSLLGELDAEAKQRALRALGKYLLAAASGAALERLTAATHLFESGQHSAVRIIAEATTEITLREPDRLAPAIAPIERALSLLRAAKRPLREQCPLLAALAIAGYFVERKHAVTYGDDALAALHDVLGLGLALKLRRYLGARVGLIAALIVTGLRFLTYRRSLPSPSFVDALTLLFMSVSALSASSGLCYDYPSTQRAADVLEPFGVLGERFAPGFSYYVCRGLATAVRDTFGESHARWVRVCALLESKQPIIGLPDNLRERYLSGLVFAMGIMDSQRDDDRSLKIAERLDSMGIALYPMSTDQLRAMYHAHQGNARLYAHFRECAEQRAIQQGAIWQNETWTLLVETVVSLRHHDAMGMKRVTEQLRSASKVVPTLQVFADRSRGAYLLLRGRAQQALPWLEKCLAEPVRCNFGWGRCHGVLARAYNELGRYADAKAACDRVLAEYSAEDLAFPGLTLLVQSERLVAEAGLGQASQARRGLEELLELHQPKQGPLTLAELHEAGVRIALLCGDYNSARKHCDEMAHWYEGTGIASLIQHCEVVRARTHDLINERLTARPRAMPMLEAEANSSTSLSVVRSFTGTDSLPLSALAQRALRVLVEQHKARVGHLYWVEQGNCQHAASTNPEALDNQVVVWLRQRILEELADTTTAKETDEVGTVAARDLFVSGSRFYRLLLLFHPAATGKDGLLGAAVVANDVVEPTTASSKVLDAVADQLQRGLTRLNEDRSSTTA
jgi:tetratricopeptide (TPR) repeat protein